MYVLHAYTQARERCNILTPGPEVTFLFRPHVYFRNIYLPRQLRVGKHTNKRTRTRWVRVAIYPGRTLAPSQNYQHVCTYTLSLYVGMCIQVHGAHPSPVNNSARPGSPTHAAYEFFTLDVVIFAHRSCHVNDTRLSLVRIDVAPEYRRFSVQHCPLKRWLWLTEYIW